jgi:hypothetical protein
MLNTSARAAKQGEEIHPGPIREAFIESSIAEPGALNQAHLSFTSVRLLKPRLHVCTHESCSIARLLKITARLLNPAELNIKLCSYTDRRDKRKQAD